MAKSLIIVESPAKTKTLKNFLGDGYIVEASMGHVRDLPEKRLGVKVDDNFEPTYEALNDRGDVLKRLAAAAKGTQTVYLASDPDREGEAIAWHLAEALNLKNARRIQFNEITRTAVQQALNQPRDINMDRVNAQQARRILDRLIGYKLSPILSKKIQKGLSAGRVQSVAVRMICEREREIQAFIPQEYWSLTATLTPRKPEKRHPFPAKLHARSGKRLEPKSEEEIDVILADLKDARYDVRDVKKREQKRNAPAPFITSTLQQEAARKLGFSNRRTMSVAQQLYEGVEIGSEGSVGLITYMRTDSVRVAAEAQTEALQFIREKYDATLDPVQKRQYSYAPTAPKQFKTKGGAQDAHEAIRSTSVYREPDKIAPYLSAEQLKLYRLIWQRFVASQMNPAIMDLTTADIHATGPANSGDPYVFRATGSVVKFDGFMRVYTEGKDTTEVADDEQPPLPPLAVDQPLDLIKLEPRQHFTEPPPRYTEATIVKALEEQGIGRPSTYAAIISTIRDRKYVDLLEKRFHPTELGFVVTDQLVKHFPLVMDVKFTADMETRLDEVEEGRVEWVSLLRNFYDPFALTVKTASTEMESLKPAPIETEYHCANTGNVMLLRQGRFGPFMGCSGFPKCRKILKLNAEGVPVEGPNFTCGLVAKEEATGQNADRNGTEGSVVANTADLPNATDHVCPEGRGRMLLRQSRYGPFLGCSEYPKCRTSLKIDADGTLKEGQEFVCTYNENAAGRNGAKKGRVAKTVKAAAPKTAKTAAPKAIAPKTTRRKTAAVAEE
jgi:DNA topoisomerase-1